MAGQEMGLALNEISGEGAAALATFLPGRTALECLSLRENEMETGGAMQLAEALPSLQGLRELDLCCNQVRPCPTHLGPVSGVLILIAVVK